MTAVMAQTPAHTIDAFHRGDFWLVQPKGAATAPAWTP